MSVENKFASFRQIPQGFPFPKIAITSNLLYAQVHNSPKKSPKYRKVGKPTKDRLVEMVESGASIVYASSKLGINYSTAKSIIQTRSKNIPQSKPPVLCENDDSNTKENQKTTSSSTEPNIIF